MNYRKLWETHYGPIPKDNMGRTFDIHHIDGNRKNNKIENLICVSLEDHYKIHLELFEKTKSEKEFRSLVFLSAKLNKPSDTLTGYTLSEETKKKISETLTGKKRPKEVVEKFTEKLKGYLWTEVQKKSRVEGLKRFYQQNDREKRTNWRKNISKSHKGKKLKNSTKEKLSKLNSKLSDSEVLEIQRLIIDGVNYKIISDKFSISPAQITSIKQKKTYKWLWN
jgi:DNA-binding NarL/FixJ family response regulator